VPAKGEAGDGETMNGYRAEDHEGDYRLYRVLHQIGLVTVFAWMVTNDSGSKGRDENSTYLDRRVSRRVTR
jgi:hypothetical protein